MLTPGEESQGDECAEFGLEALEEGCDSDEVDDHVEEVEMGQGE